MPAPFEALEDRLLRGGIAPRHVKRYLRELAEHLADLTAAQTEAGFDAADAGTRARAALGPDAELADAMLKQRDFRSWRARFPWLVFGVTPALLSVALTALALLMLGATAFVGGTVGDEAAPAPIWFRWLCQGAAVAATFLTPFLASLLMLTLALRQRMRLAWPLLAVALITVFGFHMDSSFPPPGQRGISIGLSTTMVPLPKALGGAHFHVQWLYVTAQALVALVPLAWLLLRRRSAARVQA